MRPCELSASHRLFWEVLFGWSVSPYNSHLFGRLPNLPQSLHRTKNGSAAVVIREGKAVSFSLREAGASPVVVETLRATWQSLPLGQILIKSPTAILFQLTYFCSSP